MSNSNSTVIRTAKKIELVIPQDSEVIGKQVVELGLPESAVIILIKRHDTSIVPRGATIIESGDSLLFLSKTDDLPKLKSILGIRG